MVVTWPPYLTMRPSDGNLTGGGRPKSDRRVSPDFSLMALTSAGLGSVDPGFSPKKLESKNVLVVL